MCQGCLAIEKSNAYVVDNASEKIEAELLNMQADHHDARALLSELKSAADNYNPPAGACTSFNLLYHKLKCLEEDLHQHIHLENNILFPKAIALKKELLKLNLLQ